MPGRNDPCPCGSGKKYKNCHQREDEAAPRALRLIHGSAGAAGRASGSALGLPPGAVVPTDAWEVDLVPFAAEIGDDPAARLTMLLVAAGEYVLAAEPIAHPPSEAIEVATLLARALGDACTATGVRPARVLVRLAVLVDELAELLAEESHPAHGARVEESYDLVLVDRALADFETRAGLPLAEPGVPPMSHPNSWAAWGFAPDDLARFFAACAAFYKAEPWMLLDELDMIMVRPREGGAYETTVLGGHEEVPGIALYDSSAEPPPVIDAVTGQYADPPPPRGVSLSVVFEAREELPKRMRDEVKQAKWPVADAMAYPYLTVVNTPGGGITARQLRAVIAALEAVPGFLEKHGGALTGTVEARFPLRYTEKLNGATLEMQEE